MVWGYARACDRMGIEIHPYTEVTGIAVENHRAIQVSTNRGQIAAGAVLNATAGWATTISNMAGVPLPIVTHPLQACVTEPLKPFLDTVIVSATLHVYLSQTDKGELVIGAEIDPYQSYCMKGTLPTLEQMATYTLELFPQLHGVRILRQWAGICDMTPDFAPIIGAAQQVGNFYMDVGWGTYGFKAAPISGKCMAELIATGKTPRLIEPFSPARFRTGNLVEKKQQRPFRIERGGARRNDRRLRSQLTKKGIEYFFCSFVELSGAPKAKLVPASHIEEFAREAPASLASPAAMSARGRTIPTYAAFPISAR